MFYSVIFIPNILHFVSTSKKGAIKPPTGKDMSKLFHAKKFRDCNLLIVWNYKIETQSSENKLLNLYDLLTHDLCYL